MQNRSLTLFLLWQLGHGLSSEPQRVQKYTSGLFGRSQCGHKYSGDVGARTIDAGRRADSADTISLLNA